MFKNEGEMALGLAASKNEFVDDEGKRYKCVKDGKGHSPFRVYTNERWETVESYWERFAQLKEVIALPDLPVDTKVFVKDSGQNFWFKRHFKEWNGSKVVCFGQGDTSFTESDPTDTGVWEVWEIAEGEFKGKTNVTGRE